jgi:hypothetical protein
MTPARREEIEARLKAVGPSSDWRLRQVVGLSHSQIQKIETPEGYLVAETYCLHDEIPHDLVLLLHAPADIRDLLTALDHATFWADIKVQDTHDIGERYLAAGRAQALEACQAAWRRWKLDATSPGVEKAMAAACATLGPAVPLPHDALRRENERLRDALKRIAVHDGPYAELQYIARDALKGTP